MVFSPFTAVLLFAWVGRSGARNMRSEILIWRRRFNRSITLSIIDEISCVSPEIRAFVVQFRRLPYIFHRAWKFCLAHLRSLPAMRCRAVFVTLASASSPYKQATEKQDLHGCNLVIKRIAGKRYHFFRHLSENIHTQSASGARQCRKSGQE
jgi:hypothetical protein